MKLMFRRQTPGLFGIEIKTAFTSIMLVANPLVWYYVLLIFMQQSVTKIPLNGTQSIFVYFIHFIGLVFSALVGATLTKKIDRTKFLTLWMTLNVILSATLFTLGSPNFLTISSFALLFGVFLGIGMPACMGYYNKSIPVEKRGRTSGIVMLTSGVGIVAFSIAVNSAPLILSVILAVWRLSSLIIFMSFGTSKVPEHKSSAVSYRLIFSQHSFILYLIPWIMFSLVNYLSAPLQLSRFGEQTTATMIMFQNVIMAIFSVVGGFFMDSLGRKRVAISGFVLLGLAAAVLGAFPENIVSWYFNAVIDGVAWGFLLVLFIVTIWGDLSPDAPSDKYYAVGVLPFFASKFLDVTIGGYVVDLVHGYTSALFSFVAFFLFLAVLPLVYAPETLPEKTMKDRELKNYIEKAKKEAAKAQKKEEEENTQKENEDTEVEFEVNQEDYEEALKEAEKYY
jgi:MFS family permease